MHIHARPGPEIPEISEDPEALSEIIEYIYIYIYTRSSGSRFARPSLLPVCPESKKLELSHIETPPLLCTLTYLLAY